LGWVIPEQKLNNGFVAPAGAGPGDAELITIKLQKQLGKAEVIFTDRLVNPTIISDHAGKDAEVIPAGNYYAQQVSVTTLQNCAVDYAGKQFSSPSFALVGAVVKLHEQFNWFRADERGSIFPELQK
jgi:siroheme synthase